MVKNDPSILGINNFKMQVFALKPLYAFLDDCGTRPTSLVKGVFAASANSHLQPVTTFC